MHTKSQAHFLLLLLLLLLPSDLSEVPQMLHLSDLALVTVITAPSSDSCSSFFSRCLLPVFLSEPCLLQDKFSNFVLLSLFFRCVILPSNTLATPIAEYVTYGVHSR